MFEIWLLIFLFELDKFQKETIYHIERVELVFVASLTYLGKIVVIGYPFAFATKNCMSLLYTYPIKTMSN